MRIEERDLTTTEAARIAGVCNRTVVKWCDLGLVKHYRIPGGNHRRIIEASLLALCRQAGMGVEDQQDAQQR